MSRNIRHSVRNSQTYCWNMGPDCKRIPSHHRRYRDMAQHRDFEAPSRFDVGVPRSGIKISGSHERDDDCFEEWPVPVHPKQSVLLSAVSGF